MNQAFGRSSQGPVKSELTAVGVGDRSVVVDISLGEGLHGCHRFLWPDQQDHLVAAPFCLSQG